MMNGALESPGREITRSSATLQRAMKHSQDLRTSGYVRGSRLHALVMLSPRLVLTISDYPLSPASLENRGLPHPPPLSVCSCGRGEAEAGHSQTWASLNGGGETQFPSGPNLHPRECWTTGSSEPQKPSATLCWTYLQVWLQLPPGTVLHWRALSLWAAWEVA